ncbi:fumarylacetoacetate hydrolase family protein [Chloroflexi bacterium TSY]|nr:fumarylacetoacetate hydrolase family protein [Chloroflexi bacterium TSY]
MSTQSLTRHRTDHGARWALNKHYLPTQFDLNLLLELPQAKIAGFLKSLPTEGVADDPLLPPVEHNQEIWASGVTYMRSREARKSESAVGDVYERVYDAERPEIFLKAIGWRAVGHGMPFRIRTDSKWNVPEPELVLVMNSAGEIVGYTAGNDASSRDIEGENPLYLPQAKIYNQSCAIGPEIVLTEVSALSDIPVNLEILRSGKPVFQGETRTSNMKRKLQELADYLFLEIDFPQGAFLMTGTGIVPPDEFTLQVGDITKITVGALTLMNETQQ